MHGFVATHQRDGHLQLVQVVDAGEDPRPAGMTLHQFVHNGEIERRHAPVHDARSGSRMASRMPRPLPRYRSRRARTAGDSCGAADRAECRESRGAHNRRNRNRRAGCGGSAPGCPGRRTQGSAPAWRRTPARFRRCRLPSSRTGCGWSRWRPSMPQPVSSSATSAGVDARTGQYGHLPMNALISRITPTPISRRMLPPRISSRSAGGTRVSRIFASCAHGSSSGVSVPNTIQRAPRAATQVSRKPVSMVELAVSRYRFSKRWAAMMARFQSPLAKGWPPACAMMSRHSGT